MKYIRNFKTLEEARSAGSDGMITPHLDNVETYSPINYYMGNEDDKQFNGEYDDNGKLIVGSGPIPRTTGFCAGDICYVNAGGNLGFCTKDEWDFSLGTPIGVCVVPSAHERYSIPHAASFMALNDIDESGNEVSGALMPWSDDETYSSESVPKYYGIVSTDNTEGGYIDVTENGGKCPCDLIDFFEGPYCWNDAHSRYEEGTEGNNFIPSPYLTNGEKNEDFTYTVDGRANAYNDFSGKTWTDTLYNEGKCKPATACHLYHPAGMSEGKWYIPTMGEWGYLVARVKMIGESIEACGGNTDGSIYWTTAKDNDGLNIVMGGNNPSRYPNSETLGIRPFIVLAYNE